MEKVHKFLVSTEIVVLRPWKSETWKFGIIKQVDERQITSDKTKFSSRKFSLINLLEFTTFYCNIKLCFNLYKVTNKLGNPIEIDMLTFIRAVNVTE